MLDQLSKEVNIGKIKDAQMKQHFNILYAEGAVPATALGGMGTYTINVSNEGDFWCHELEISYTTLTHPAADDLDDGADHLRMKIRDLGNSVDLFDDFVPLHLFATPGRVRRRGVVLAPGALTVGDSSMRFMPKRFVHVFPANTNIQLEVKNDSTAINYFSIAFTGIRIKSPKATAGLNPPVRR